MWTSGNQQFSDQFLHQGARMQRRQGQFKENRLNIPDDS
jgi:hypothetical protein